MTNPLLSDDPLASLLLRPAQGPAVPVRYRSGVLTSWDISNGSNTVLVDGVPLTNLPVLTGSYLSILARFGASSAWPGHCSSPRGGTRA